jgi:hypothetical protein
MTNCLRRSALKTSLRRSLKRSLRKMNWRKVFLKMNYH